MKYRGRSAGSAGAAQATVSSICSRLSPTARPPSAKPSNGSATSPSIERPRSSGSVPALGDPEAELTRSPRRVDLPLGPELRPSDGLLVLDGRGVRGRADVEAHGDVRPEPPLDLGDALRRQALGAPVVDGAERHPLVVDLHERVAQREDLEAARVRQDRPAPSAERVQPAELLDHVLARAEVEVVGVARGSRPLRAPEPRPA